MGVPTVAQQKQVWLASMRLRVQSLAWLSGLRTRIAVSCSVGCRHGLNPVLLWLCCRLAAAAPIWPLAWEPPYALGTALEKDKRQKNKKKNKNKTNHNTVIPKKSISSICWNLLESHNWFLQLVCWNQDPNKVHTLQSVFNASISGLLNL